MTIDVDTLTEAELPGIVARYNRKSVTVIAGNGQRWNVAPVFLHEAEAGAAEAPPRPRARAVGTSR